MPKMSNTKKTRREYIPRSEKDVDEHANQSGGRFDSIYKQGVDTWTPKPGDNTIRFLEPTWDDHRHYGYEIFIHSRVGADNSNYLCLLKMKKKPCPICEAMVEAKRAGEEDDAKALTPQKRFVCWIIDRDERSPDPQLYSMSWSIDRDIASLCKDKRTGKILFLDHPYEGYDVSFRREGQLLKTKYFGFQIDHEATPLVDDDTKLEEIRDYIAENPVPDQLKYYSYEHLQQVIKGATDDKDEELDDKVENEESEDEDERPTHTPRHRREEDEEEQKEVEITQYKKRSVKSPRDEEDEDNVEDTKPKRLRSNRQIDEEDEDEEEEEKKKEKPPSNKRPVKRQEDDEDDPLPDEDEDEEDKPKIRRRK